MKNLSVQWLARRLVYGLLIALALHTLSACEEASAASGDIEVINAVAGDRSWEESRGGSPAEAGEDERIATHLRWVEARLRQADVTALSAAQRRRRGALIDELQDYRQARAFPRHSTASSAQKAPGTRRPRFVDDQGRHCAVAHLIAASGRPELVSAIQRDHELDFVADMEVAALDRWATTHGFSRHELALIQPSYSHGNVNIPSKHEQEWAEKKRREAAKKPRPLTSEYVRDIVTRFASDRLVRTCVGERTGRWKMEATLRVKRDLKPRAEVRMQNLADEKRDKKLETCFERELLRRARVWIALANHTFEEELHETHSVTIHAATASEIEAELLKRDRRWRSDKTRKSATAKCVAEMPSDAFPLQVPLRVRGLRGDVHTRWKDVSAKAKASKKRASKEQWECIRYILAYGDLPVHGVNDHDFDIEVLRDGTIRIAK